MNRQDLWTTVLLYAPIVGFVLSVLVSLLCRVMAGRVVRISHAWVVVAVAYGVWIFCAAGVLNSPLRSYTGLDGPAWAAPIAYFLIVGLFLGLPIVTLATIVAIGSQIAHTVAGLRVVRVAPAASAEPEA